MSECKVLFGNELTDNVTRVPSGEQANVCSARKALDLCRGADQSYDASSEDEWKYVDMQRCE